MLEARPARAILLLGAPLVATGFLQAATPFVDALFVYNAAGDGAGASVAFAGPIAGVAGAFGAGLGAAGLAVIGQAAGSGDRRGADYLARRFLALALAAGSLAGLLLAFGASLFLGPLEAGLRGDAAAYLALSALGLPLLYFTQAYTAIASARGRTEKPFWRALLGFGAKLCLDALFVLFLRGGARGAGWASLGSSLLVAAFMAWDLARGARDAASQEPAGGGESGAPAERRRVLVEPGVASSLLRLALPAALTQASVSLSFILMNGQAASYGRDVLNGFTIANTTNSLFFAPAAAIGQAVATMVAISSGAGRADRCREATRTGLALGLLLSTLLACCLLPGASALVSLFSRDPGVLRHAADAMRVFSVSILGFTLFSVVIGAFSGIGRTEVPFLIAVLRIWVLRVPVAWLLQRAWPGLGPYSVWLSMGVSNFGTAAAALLLLRGIRYDHRALGRAA